MAGRMEGDVRADPLEAREHLLERFSPEVEDAITVASEPLHLAGEIAAALRVEHHVRVCMASLQRGDLPARGPARQPLAREIPQDEARGVLLPPGAMANGRLFPARSEERRVGKEC